MSVYKSRDGRSPYFHYDFQVRGHRFHGTTKQTSRREAEKVEAIEREKARALVAQLAVAKTSLKLDDVAGRYWTEHAQHLAGATNTWRNLGLVLDFLGKDGLITDITDDDVAKLVAWRRGHKYNRGYISPFTVNDTVATLRALFARCPLQAVGRAFRL